ncbi:MAG: Lrp/AsnC family transcriptional regulator [Candidatus Bathyarchaeia archaeon]
MDDVDRKIISQLQIDGRATLEELAKNVGFTSMGVKKRLQRLIQQSAIKVSASLNPFFLKLFPAVVLLEMESSEAMQKLLERFKDCPRVIHIFKTLGGYNLIALVVAENQDTLENLLKEGLSPITFKLPIKILSKPLQLLLSIPQPPNKFTRLR